MIIEKGSEDGKIHIYNLIQEGSVNNTLEMHGQLEKENLGMDKQVRRIGGNVSLNGNKVFYVIVKNWICSLSWHRQGSSSLGQTGPFDNSGEYSTRLGSELAIGSPNLVSNSGKVKPRSRRNYA